MSHYHYDYLIVGAGLFGAAFARLATDKGKKCLVIEKRAHKGGNLYCEEKEGICVHKYGPHVFHTSNKRVWDFVNSFASFNGYINSPLANYKGKIYNLPFNMNTFYQIWGITSPSEAMAEIERQKREAMTLMGKKGMVHPHNLEEQALMLVGKEIYEILIKGYTEKQWGRTCTELPAFIIRRLPVRFTFDNAYFDDIYQGIPVDGYNKLITGLLEGVDVELDTDFFADRKYWESVADKMVFTGKIDEFYGYRYGKLQYRSLLFEEEVIEMPNYQGNAVVNYTDRQIPYTRIIEHKHFGMSGDSIYTIPKTIITKEYPTEWNDGKEAYYPINDIYNDNLADKYRNLAKREDKIVFGGRLAEYKYYDMDSVIERVLNMENEI